MSLIINNHNIKGPIIDIIKKLRYDCNGEYLNKIDDKGKDLLVQCPFHKNGQERTPACNIYNFDDNKLELGYFRCFACGEQGHLYHLVAHCLGVDDNTGKQWLVDNFGTTLVEYRELLPEINITNKNKNHYLDEGILTNYDFYHPYMWQRKLSKEIVDRFRIGYNHNNHSITFPVYDEKNKLVMITERFINFKRFVIPDNVEKPVYLLNEILKNKIDTVVVCESQINCLYSWSLGYPAICLFGTGSKHQYELLNKSPIRHYYLAFDGDIAGEKGKNKFIQNIRDDVIIDILNIPSNKDLNDLSDIEVKNLFKIVDFQ